MLSEAPDILKKCRNYGKSLRLASATTAIEAEKFEFVGYGFSE